MLVLQQLRVIFDKSMLVLLCCYTSFIVTPGVIDKSILVLLYCYTSFIVTAGVIDKSMLVLLYCYTSLRVTPVHLHQCWCYFTD